jgi:hypothetical protein
VCEIPAFPAAARRVEVRVLAGALEPRAERGVRTPQEVADERVAAGVVGVVGDRAHGEVQRRDNPGME